MGRLMTVHLSGNLGHPDYRSCGRCQSRGPGWLLQWPLVLALLSGQAQHSVVCSARLAGVRWSLWVTHALPQMPFWGPRAPGPRAATPVAPELQRPASRARGPVAQACLCPTRGGPPALPLQGGPGKATVYCLQGGPWALSPSSWAPRGHRNSVLGTQWGEEAPACHSEIKPGSPEVEDA